MLDAGGGGAMYAVQIESLEVFQQKLTTILQSLEQDNTVMRMSGDGTGIFGSFPEAQTFSSAYEQTKQDLINSFNEVTQLVNTMISVVGANADKYKQTEQDITSKFNAILQQYGDAPTTTTTTTGTGTGTGTGGTTYYPQGSGTTYTTQPSTTNGGTTNTTTTTTTGSGTTSTSAGAA